MSRLILVLEVEPIDRNQVFTEWPLHCTLVHWFDYADKPEALATALEAFFSKRSSINLIGGEEALFGEKRSVPVNLVVPTSELIKLHADILDFLKGQGIRFTAEQFLGAGYLPHITEHHGRRLKKDDMHRSEAVYLVKSVSEKPKQRQVVRRIELGA